MQQFFFYFRFRVLKFNKLQTLVTINSFLQMTKKLFSHSLRGDVLQTHTRKAIKLKVL